MTTLAFLQRVTFIGSLIAGFVLNHMSHVAGLSMFWVVIITACGFSGVLAVSYQLLQEHLKNVKLARKMSNNYDRK